MVTSIFDPSTIPLPAFAGVGGAGVIGSVPAVIAEIAPIEKVSL